jgi:pimeloyl-ACP methyl ester carboxylesterase
MKKLKINNFNLTYSTEGEGSDVILLHGFPSDIFFWEKIKTKLKKNFRVTSIEQRGYPLSKLNNPTIDMFNIDNLSNDIETLIETNRLNKNTILVGHDWGSIVAWAVVSREKVKISKLVSICGGTEFPHSDIYDELNYSGNNHYISSFQDPKSSSKFLSQNLDKFFRSSYRLVKNNITHPDLSLNSLFFKYKNNDLIHNVDIERMINSFYNDLYQPISWYANINNNIMLSNEWRRVIEIPVDFLFGGLDTAVKFNSKMESRLKKSGKNVNIKLVSDADHWLPLTHEESVIESITNI